MFRKRRALYAEVRPKGIRVPVFYRAYWVGHPVVTDTKAYWVCGRPFPYVEV